MRQVSKSALKAKMLQYFREVEKTGEELIVTSDGVPVLKVVPLKKKEKTKTIFSNINGQVKYHSDILASTIDEWPES
ncbi:MAG: type II toxin-antitoxin system prevent-host-death family antitoxin [Deltaproteobacteria bacterium]|nr:type II toxin-antitoxin system prevent-host-death family antitoxin [Deltaproteobacteria bacterium]